MHIGNRSFPYPVLNRNEALSDYAAKSTFKLEFDVDENGAPIVKNGEVIFKNLHFTLTDSTLIELLEQVSCGGHSSWNVLLLCTEVDLIFPLPHTTSKFQRMKSMEMWWLPAICMRRRTL